MNICVFGVALVVSSLGRVAAARPAHDGFTGDLGLGVSLTTVSRDLESVSCSSSGGCTASQTTEHETHFGLASLSLTLGAFVTPQLAFGFRSAGTLYFKDNTAFNHSFYGGIAEIWLHDRFYVSGGPGLAVQSSTALGGFSSTNGAEAGFGLDLRAGVALINARNHDLTLSLEALPGFYDEGLTMGYTLVAAWKWY